MAGLLPLIFVLVIAESSAAARPLHQPQWSFAIWWWPLVLTLSFVTWAAVSEVVARLVARRGSWRVMMRADLALQGAILAWFAWLCYGWGWSWHHRSFTVALLPWLAVQMVHWWSQTHAVRVISGHPWTRSARVLYQLRFGVLPVLLILPFFDVGEWLAQTLDIERFYDPSQPFGLLLTALSVQGFLLAVLALLPVLLVWLWGAKPLDQTELVGHLRSLCDRMGVRVAGLMRWPVPGGRIYNAAVVGIMPRFRYVLFTDDLMHDLPPDQLAAVLGHELGHARHGHLWLYFLFATTVVLTVTSTQGVLAEVLRPAFDRPPTGIAMMGRLDPWAGVSRGLAAILLLAVMWRLLFGVLSRACERQADLAGAQLVGDARIMAAALKSVAHLAGQPENAPSWRHHSIAQRVAFMERVHADPAAAILHHRAVTRMRNLLIALCCAVAAALAVEFWLSPAALAPRDPVQARQELARWTETDTDLSQALSFADRGDPRPLSTWINRAGDFERQRLLRAVLIEVQDDTREGYRRRHRLRAFLNLSSGDHDLDLMLENGLAYVLVAGCEQPTVQDLAVVRELLPRMEETVKRLPDHGLLDTVGCMRFALGEYVRAADHFTAAVAAQAKAGGADRLPPLQRGLYQRRLEAARANAGGARLPLPKDWVPATTAPAIP